MEILREGNRRKEGPTTLLCERKAGVKGSGRDTFFEGSEWSFDNQKGWRLSYEARGEPDPNPEVDAYYNYTINLSLDDLVEIIDILSRDAGYKSRPALLHRMETTGRVLRNEGMRFR